MASVSFENVCKVYDRNRVVNDFNFLIKDREFIVIVGPSGCGKSTTLRMVAGLESISSGFIRINNTIVNDIPPKDRDIAMVFQNYALYPHMTVYNNMGFGLKLRKIDPQEIDRRVKRAAEILGIEELLDRKPKQLSGGQRQRVAVGRAIVREPAVFLFDEPLSNLDAKLRVQMRAEIKRLHLRLNATMIYVTHDQVEAMTMGDRIVILKDGDLQQAGSPLEVYRYPRNQFVAGFIGSPSMNFLPVQLETQSDIPILKSPFFNHSIHPDYSSSFEFQNIRDVTFGIRPEDLWISESDQISDRRGWLNGFVEIVETTGSDTLLHVKIGEDIIVAKVSSDCQVESRTTVKLCFDQNKMHLFNTSTGESLRRVM